MQGNTAFVKTVKTDKHAKAGRNNGKSSAPVHKGKQWTRDSDKRKHSYTH